MDFTETYTLAHTARCKLKLAADRPDRNLRFILGHAFTLDKLRLRLAEIEVSDSEDDFYPDDDGGDQPTCTGNVADAPIASEPKARRVSFGKSHDGRPAVAPHRQRSPPPEQFDSDSNSGSSSDEDYEEMDGELGLQRFASASGQPPRIVPDLEADDGDEDHAAEPRSPTEEELRMITGGGGNDGLKDAYTHVAGCPCHGELGAPSVEKVWEVPRKIGSTGPRVAVVQVAA